ncbi:MAG: hypothetical protein LBL19_03295 [Spirochaetaceae bacterium]|jgi:hypothetical protein|nr:hypothetical protein [Spirochaetaceae bacterium]
MEDRIEKFEYEGKKFIYAEYDIRVSRFPRYAMRTVRQYIVELFAGAVKVVVPNNLVYKPRGAFV